MQLPAPMHLWRSTRARSAISRDPTAASPRKASDVASARLEVPSRANSRVEAPRHLVLGAVELGGDLGVRPALGQELQQAALGLVEARCDRRRLGSGSRRSRRSGSVIGPGQLDELAPDRSRQPGDADLLVRRPLGDPRQRLLEVAAHDVLDLGRAAGEHRPGRRDARSRG